MQAILWRGEIREEGLDMEKELLDVRWVMWIDDRGGGMHCTTAELGRRRWRRIEEE
jgi:hypothetical protein